MIQEQFVSSETAKLLAEKECPDFGYSCIYDAEGIKCQTQAIVMRWLREEKNIHINVYTFNRELPISENTSYTVDVATEKDSPMRGHLRGVWKTYEEAAEAGIRFALEHKNHGDRHLIFACPSDFLRE